MAEYGIVCAVEVDPAGVANTIIVPATGGNITIGSNVIPVHTVGRMNPFDDTTGPVNLSGRVDFIVQGTALLNLALAAQGAQYTLFDVTVGTYKITGCKMSNLTLNASIDDVLKGSFSFVGASWSTVAVPTLPTAVPAYRTWIMTSTLLGTLNAASVDISVDNSIKAVHYMGVGGLYDRNPQYLADGYQTIKFNAKLVDRPTVPLETETIITADTLAPITPTIVFVDTGPALSINTMTITLTNALASEIAQDLDAEDLVRYGINYEAASIGWAIVTT